LSPLPKKTVVIAMGNDILGDDAVGLRAAACLRAEFLGRVEFVETPAGGLNLLDHLEGYQRALILDSIMTGAHPPGTILAFEPHQFGESKAPSPHFAGLPEVMQMAAHLHIPIASDVRILAMEILEPYVVREGLSAPVQQALPAFVAQARRLLALMGSGL
jgi:hydrogenase maturation protease